MKKVFSGENSEDFWARVNMVECQEVKELWYDLGCKLQNLEDVIGEEFKKLNGRIDEHQRIDRQRSELLRHL